jgi:hypothetical protein
MKWKTVEFAWKRLDTLDGTMHLAGWAPRQIYIVPPMRLTLTAPLSHEMQASDEPTRCYKICIRRQAYRNPSIWRRSGAIVVIRGSPGP